ncbi:MAG TPA: Crp/Fnr family transcriptional regulator [Acidobacteriaceae bacterium]|nr:Crp/Fnr family transcriptional regulator [Acidobacteriaceae bacterium]
MDRIAKRVEALGQTRFFGSLDQEGLRWLAARAHEQHLAAGEMLFFSGEPASGMFVVISGTIRAFQQNTDGREQVMHVDRAGATIADVPVFDDGPYPASAIAEEDTDLLLLRKEDVRELCLKQPTFALSALKLMAERVRKHAHLVNVLSLHEVGQRLAFLLLSEAEKTGQMQKGSVNFKLDLSNHEIATHIGTVRDVVSRALARLQQLGLVTLKLRAVRIPDVQALKVYAEGQH